MIGAVKGVDGELISLEDIKIIDKCQVGSVFKVLGYLDYRRIGYVVLATLLDDDEATRYINDLYKDASGSYRILLANLSQEYMKLQQQFEEQKKQLSMFTQIEKDAKELTAYFLHFISYKELLEHLLKSYVKNKKIVEQDYERLSKDLEELGDGWKALVTKYCEVSSDS